MFTAPTITGPAGLKGLDGLAALGTLAMLPTGFIPRFGRIARSYPALPPRRTDRVSPAAVLRDEGLATSAARLFARALGRLAEAADRRARQWAQARQLRRTEHALRELDSRTLRDIGFTRVEVSSVAAEAAGLVEASRIRVWRDAGSRIV